MKNQRNNFLIHAKNNRTKKQVRAINSLDLSNKKDLIRVKLIEIVNLQDFIKTDNLCYKSKSRKAYNSSEYTLPIVF